MSDDLGPRLQAVHERTPHGDPDLTGVLRGGRRRKLRRRIVAASLATVVATVGVAGAVRLTGDERVTAPDRDVDVADHDDGVFVPADENDATYELFDFEVLYPWAPVDSRPVSERERERYCSIRSDWECGHRREQAGFSYKWRWATSEYPGDVQCRVVLEAADGSVAGEATWGLSGLARRTRRAHVVGVRVSDEPVRARARCEGGAYERGRGVVVEFVRAEPYTPTYVGGESPPAPRIRLLFEAIAVTEGHVGSRMCFMTVWFESGRKETAEFTTNRGEGTWRYETGYPASDPVTDAKIRCRAIR